MSELLEMLSEAGTDAREPITLSSSAMFYETAGGRDAVDLWFRLSRELPRQGKYPILATDRAAIDYLRQCAAARPAQAPAPQPNGRQAHELIGDLSPRVFRKSLPACLLDRDGEPLERCWMGIVTGHCAGDIVRALGFGGVGSCPAPDRLAETIANWSRRYGAVPVAFKHSMIEFVVARPPVTAEAALELAQEQHAIAPDVAKSGLGSIEKLATALNGLPYWALWWD